MTMISTNLARRAALMGCVLLLAGCGESDFTTGKWTTTTMPDFNCRGNLDVLVVGEDRIQYAALGQVRGDWGSLKTQYRQDGALIDKGSAGEIFRFREESDGRVTLEDAPATIALSWRLPREIVRCGTAEG
jgi:major membrane immunogen (membrane-anchored lipoprotein)